MTTDTHDQGLWHTTEGVGPRVVLLHGFTQNEQSWGPIASRLVDSHEVVRIDAPGHGRSGHDAADLWHAARLIGQAGDVANYIGYSMGARMALHLALSQPALVESLVLVGATAGLASETERADRRAADDALATKLLADGLPAFLDAWLASPLFATLDAQAAGKQERLENRPEGLAASLRSVGTGQQAPLWDRLAELSMPVLVVAGTSDQKFTALGHRLVEAIGANATFGSIQGGHAVHLERPLETTALLQDFLANAV